MLEADLIGLTYPLLQFSERLEVRCGLVEVLLGADLIALTYPLLQFSERLEVR